MVLIQIYIYKTLGDNIVKVGIYVDDTTLPKSKPRQIKSCNMTFVLFIKWFVLGPQIIS